MNGAPYTLHLGDCRAVLATLADASVDSIVTDPPYELGFMGKGWDASGIANDRAMWAECLRVLKPGGHLLAFSGSRTYHRMVCAIEDSGFEVRDQIMWLYGSGFPKSMNVGKAIDDAARGEPQGGAKPSSKNHGKFKGGCSDENEAGRGFGAGPGAFMATSGDRDDRELVREARQWSGWGTALKPAHEPICVARKPFKGTVAANVLEHGTGALNIDACRVATGDKLGGGNCKGDSTGKFVNDGWRRPWMDDAAARDALAERVRGNVEKAEALGRWPANVIHDGSTEVLEAFAEFGERGAFAPVKGTEPSSMTKSVFGQINRQASNAFHGDTGTAARFFYCAKASRADRNHGLEDPGPQFKKGTTLRDVEVMAAAGEIKGNTHPTVKPTDLMAYLCRLVTPAGGVVLDPFMGSGSTGKAAMRERFRFIGIDMTPEYVEIARARIDASWRAAEAVRQVCEPSPQIDLFEEMA